MCLASNNRITACFTLKETRSCEPCEYRQNEPQARVQVQLCSHQPQLRRQLYNQPTIWLKGRLHHVTAILLPKHNEIIIPSSSDSLTWNGSSESKHGAEQVQTYSVWFRLFLLGERCHGARVSTQGSPLHLHTDHLNCGRSFYLNDH